MQQKLSFTFDQFDQNHTLLLTLVRVLHVSIRGSLHMTSTFKYNLNMPYNHEQAFLNDLYNSKIHKYN